MRKKCSFYETIRGSPVDRPRAVPVKTPYFFDPAAPFSSLHSQLLKGK